MSTKKAEFTEDVTALHISLYDVTETASRFSMIAQGYADCIIGEDTFLAVHQELERTIRDAMKDAYEERKTVEEYRNSKNKAVKEAIADREMLR